MSGKTKKKNTGAVSVESYKHKIVTFLRTYNKKAMPISELESKCRTKKSGHENFAAAFDELRTEGVVTVRKGMKAALCSALGLKVGEITRLSRTFGFAVTDDGIEYFIPGKCMLGAMPHDRVLIADIPSRSGEPEGEVQDIISFGSSELTGRIEFVDDTPYLVPDTASKNHVIIVKDGNTKFSNGDKVLAEIVFRGRRHAEHKVRIVSVFGIPSLQHPALSPYSASTALLPSFRQRYLKKQRKYPRAEFRNTTSTTVRTFVIWRYSPLTVPSPRTLMMLYRSSVHQRATVSEST